LRTEFSIKRNIEPEKWLSNVGIVKGNNEESKSINAYLNTVRYKINDHYRQMLEGNKLITPETIKNAYLGVKEKGKSLIDVFKYHNSQVKELLHKDFSLGTYERYCTALSHTQEFIQWKYKTTDIEIKEVSYEFVTEFEYYLKTIRKCSHNTAIKYITNLKKIIRICIGHGWINRDPFTNYKIQLREVEREYLLENEIQEIANKEFHTERLEQVRDVFLFCCFTGLAYSDVQKLNKEHIILGIDGEKWIKINRTKTDTRSSIPLLPIPSALIEKYSSNPKCSAKGRLLPVLTNQKMNGYLKEIADLCGINKNITSHLARHTFATTVTLTNGVPLESVSKMLGHRSLRTTQHYAKIIDRKVSDDMQILKRKFAGKPNTLAIKVS
jgi:site-specific recombinase XerD